MKRVLHIYNHTDEEGSIAIAWALLIPVVIGGLALAMDSGLWQFNKRDLQSAVDASTQTAGYEIPAEEDADLQGFVEVEMARNGFSVDDGVTITVTYPPDDGGYSGNNNAIEVEASQPIDTFFSGYFVQTDPTLTARAVGFRQAGGDACILALDTLEDSAVDIGGSPAINMNCAAASNSSSESAIDISGKASLTVTTLYTPGNYSVSGSGSLTTTETAPQTGGSPLVDPYEGLSVPAYTGCDQNSYTAQTTETLSPGVYCNGLSVNSGAIVTMDPGVYIIDRGVLSINGGSTITGTDVTIILTSSTGADYAYVRVNGGADITLSAPTTGDFAGVAFYQDQNAPEYQDNRFNGGSDMDITGTLYFPRADLQFTGGNSIGGSCTQIIGQIVDFSGNASLTSDCEGTGIEWVTAPGLVRLVE